MVCSFSMTSSSRLRGRRALLPSLSLLVACSAGKPLDQDPNFGVGGTGGANAGGTSGSAALGQGGSSASGQGGSSATGQGGSSATGGTSGSAATGGTDTGSGGTPSTGGSAAGGTGGAAAGGTGGSAASGGDAGMSATGGGAATGGSAGVTGTGGTGGTDTGICQQLSVIPTPQVPTVELLVDTSSSMFTTTPTAWSVLYTALMDPAKGAVKALQDKIRFGFASYEGLMGTSETDPACATMTTVAPAELNYAAIDAVYSKIGAGYDLQHPTPQKWETPTDYAIAYAANILSKYMPDPPGKKYILLVTDGNPNTCQKTDPQCGQDLAIKAAQDAFAQGVGLFVLGIGDIVSDPNNGCPTSGRCGLLHLQDMANAGVGAPVQPAPGCDDPTSTGCQYKYSGCNPDNVLLASYTPAAPDVGTPYHVDTAAADAQTKLTAALSTLLSDAISCTVSMDAMVTGDASLGVVKVGGTAEKYNDADGWVLDQAATSVTLQGAACTSFKSGQDLQITFPCDPSGNPIAVHR
jgi:hypothetical protein